MSAITAVSWCSPVCYVLRSGVILNFGACLFCTVLIQQGLKFVVITGARLSTLLMRLPYLPEADAFVCENGG
jgi:hypothetical protein